ncbi:aldolase/citrate lyase family protein [Mycobacterium sp. UM_CSW]|uniref:HpcH/HpaI aldolase family protein n=1 Tax=Mycobacterium sp. UM_CSW TaxID=1370119 RepID=UPI0003F9A108|nr:aldolase/citrate lyase family protein [Mycobacterium sp. UM_CSW]
MDAAVRCPRERIRERFARGEPSFGSWLTLGSPDLLEALTQTPFDYVGIDCQHGAISESDIPGLLGRPTEMPRFVRVSANNPALIGKVLDSGADGIIVPMVNSAAEATAAVAAATYPSEGGNRSYGPIAAYLPREPEGLAERSMILAMVETVDGAKNVDEILGVPGIDGIYIGPADLGIALGLGHRQFPPSEELCEVLTTFVTAANNAGKIPAVHAALGLAAPRFLELGFMFMTLGTERLLLALGAAAELERARGVTAPAAAVSGIAGPY